MHIRTSPAFTETAGKIPIDSSAESFRISIIRFYAKNKMYAVIFATNKKLQKVWFHFSFSILLPGSSKHQLSECLGFPLSDEFFCWYLSMFGVAFLW